MYNKLLNFICVLSLSAQAVFADEPVNQAVKSSEINKIIYALLGVIIFSLLIYFGLSLYNKFFVPKYLKDANLKEDSLSSPTDFPDAVRKFIVRNRLR